MYFHNFSSCTKSDAAKGLKILNQEPIDVELHLPNKIGDMQ